MECPVCYDDCHKTCNLVCSHSMCMSCVKQWWVKSEGSPTCPICRCNLYFRGMRKVVDRWVDEMEEPPEYDEEDWDDVCEYLIEIKEQFRLPWICLIEPVSDEITITYPVIYCEFPAIWFPPVKTHLTRPKGRRRFRGRRSNWLEE